MPKLRDGNRESEWEPNLPGVEQPERYWELDARSRSIYDRANGALQFVSSIWAWVAKNSGPLLRYFPGPPIQISKLDIKDELSEASWYAESRRLTGHWPGVNGP